MKQTNSNALTVSLLLAFILLFALPSVQVANAWQLGGTTYQSVGYQAIRSTQGVYGSTYSGYFIGAVSAFTDTNNRWHAIAVDLIYDSSPTTVQVEGEYTDGNGINHPIVLCTGLPKNIGYDDYITYYGPGQDFYYHSSGSGCAALYSPAESGVPSINSGGSIDVMESTDNTPSHFQNNYAYVIFYPTLRYYVSGGWAYSSVAYSFNSGAVSTVGLYMACNPYQLHQVVESVESSTYAPPPGNNQLWIQC